MTKCPSKYCNYDNPEGARYCSGCSLDLNLPKDEIEGRDEIYRLFMLVTEEAKNENPKLYKEMKEYFGDIKIGVFHSCIEKIVGRLFLITLDVTTNTKGNKKEITMLGIEKEKLNILKEIRDELKKKKILKMR